MGGRRISLWIGPSDEWIVTAADRLVERAVGRGLPLTRSDVLREALRGSLGGLSVAGDVAEEPGRVSAVGPVGVRLSARVPRRYRALMEMLRRIVNAKRELGLRATVPGELFRLANNGLIKSLEGAEIDREVLRADSESDA